MSKHPARTPVVEPAYDPNSDRYWDPKDLEQELLRTFQVCHECRMCVTYCGSFPILFDAIDREIDGGRAEGSENVASKTIHAVTDHCWQCKLCYIKCPYTPDEGARELLDFPRLMAREKAQRSRRDGVPIVDQVLGEPQLIGALSVGPQAKIANFVNSKRLVRKVVEKVTGISAEFPLPPIATEAFTSWHRSHSPSQGAGVNGQIVLFPTCYGEYNFPEVPRAAVQVLEHNGYDVVVPEALTCCGMPNLDGGDIDAARAKMRKNVELLAPYVKRGMRIVVPGPTCGYTMKKEWPVYLATQEAKDVSARTFDLMEFLDGLRREKRLLKDFKSGLGRVAYHASCHLRAQKIAIPGARVLSLLPDTEVRIIERCSAVDGTWGMKAKYYEEGVRYAKRLSVAIEDERPNVGDLSVVTDCSLAALRVLKENGRAARHPVVALAEAYGFGAESRAE